MWCIILGLFIQIWDEAVILLKECYEKRCVVLGTDYDDTLAALEGLNRIYWSTQIQSTMLSEKWV